MSLILGIYSKKEKLNKYKIKEVLGEFPFNKKRKLQTISSGKIFLSALKFRANSGCIVKNENGYLTILFGGEVYDFNDKMNILIEKGHKFKDKKNCAEFILHSYEEYGSSFFKDINGIFSFAIYDRLKDELILGNDSFGLRPLFIYNAKECCIFSSEYEPIIKYKKFDKELNYDAIAEYFTLGYPLGGKTFFQSINNLLPGSLLKIRKNQTSLKRYDLLDIKINKNKDLNYFAKEISKVFKKAVQNRVKSLGTLHMFLSGGADTRLILSNLSKDQRDRIKFYTWKNPYLKEDEDRDVIIAKMLTKKLNLNHKITGVKIKRTSKKFLGGLCGGEFLGGGCFNVGLKIEKVNKKKTEESFKKIFSEKFLENISFSPYSSLKKTLRGIKAENKEFLFNIHQITRGFFTNVYGGSSGGWLNPYHFRQNTPFWDKDFLKVLLTVPKDYLINYKLYNQVYKDYYQELIKIPTNNELLVFKSNDYYTLITKFTYKIRFITRQVYKIDFFDKLHYRILSKLASITGSCMELMDKGIEHKSIKKQENSKILSKILRTYMKSNRTWEKNFYNQEYIKSLSEDKNHPIIQSFIDFETWYKKFISIK